MTTDLIAPAFADHPPTTPPCLLLVEDDSMMREMMARELRRAGYRVLTAGHCGEALEHLQREATAIDLIISDFRLPPLTALDLVALLRAAGPTPEVLICSGLFLPETVAALDAAHLPHRLQKPFTFGHLLHAVQELLPIAPRPPAIAAQA
jgi:DNA-binding response OmpR family regulator